MKRIFGVFTIILFLTLAIYSASKKKYEVLSYKCVGCADCIDICPKDAITIKRGKAVIDPEECIGCSQCVYMCSFFAVRAYDSSDKIAKTKIEKNKVAKTKRRERRKKTAKPDADRYSIVDELEKIAKLKNSGAITEEEYIEAKKKLLFRKKQ
ncbi:4Fe-4S binding protein [Fibrobacterota bacterium]